VRDGARLPTVENVDYTVIVQGSSTEIAPLATSAVIRPNDPLEISYIYTVDPNEESRTDSRSMLVSADWGWVALTAIHEEQIHVPLSGQEATLIGDRNRDSVRIDLRGKWRNLDARANGTASKVRDTQLMYDEQRVSGQIAYRPSYNWQLGMVANHSDIEFLDPRRQSQQDDVRLDATWSPNFGWFTSGFLSHRTLRDTEIPSETVDEAGIRVTRRWTRLDVYATLGLGNFKRGDTESTNANLHIAVNRRF
jgi:hypothetical protein